MTIDEDYLRAEEQILSLIGGDAAPLGPIFILGSPRTGSTFLYQAMAAAFELPYITNLTNDCFADVPIVGLSIQAAWPQHELLSAESRYGKTRGPFQPSEGSAVMRRWFGGGHPSELVSSEILPGQTEHMQATVGATTRLFGRPLLTKNAWNCFRIAALARILPTAAFIWIRRSIEASATSDLNARYVVQGDPQVWNSATPRNVDDLRELPYWEQVVENQVAFARAIKEGFAKLPARQTATIWYEDLCATPTAALDQLANQLAALDGFKAKRVLPVRGIDEKYSALQSGDREKIAAYIALQGQRLSEYAYRRASY